MHVHPPTQVLAGKTGFAKEQLLGPGKLSLVTELPFDSGIKRMSMIVADDYDPNGTANGGLRLLTKGAFEGLLPLCTHIRTPRGDESLRHGNGDDARLREHVESLAKRGLRVLAFATRALTAEEAAMALGPNGAEEAVERRAQLEQGLVFLGLAGLMDPPREEVRTCVLFFSIAMSYPLAAAHSRRACVRCGRP